MSFISVIKADLAANRSNTKGRFIVIFFRLVNFFSSRKRNPIWFILGIVLRITYKFLVQWMMGIDLPEATKIGKGLCIFHGQGLVINQDVVIGERVTLRHNSTIGNKYAGGKSPVIADNVDVGANVVIIGDIRIGNNVVVGAGTVLTKDVPDGAIVVGNPGRLINKEL